MREVPFDAALSFDVHKCHCVPPASQPLTRRRKIEPCERANRKEWNAFEIEKILDFPCELQLEL